MHFKSKIFFTVICVNVSLLVTAWFYTLHMQGRATTKATNSSFKLGDPNDVYFLPLTSTKEAKFLLAPNFLKNNTEIIVNLKKLKNSGSAINQNQSGVPGKIDYFKEYSGILQDIDANNLTPLASTTAFESFLTPNTPKNNAKKLINLEELENSESTTKHMEWQASDKPGNVKEIMNSSFKCDQQENNCNFLVKGFGCSIPYHTPFHKTVKKFLKTVNITCSKKSYAYVQGNVLQINKTAISLHYNLTPDQIKCAIFTIVRPADRDDVVSKELVLNNFSDKYESKNDFLEVTCKNGLKTLYDDFFIFIHSKPEVERKCNAAQKNVELKQNSSSLRPEDKLSILLIGFDSMSHLNFLRRMPLSYSYLKRDMAAIELQGYTKLADNTFPCLVPMLTGKTVWELGHWSGPYDDYPLIWKSFAEKGYRTLFAEDYPWISIFNHEKKGFKNPPADYYLRPLYLVAESSEMRKGEENTHCFNSRLEVSVILDWVFEFMRLFRSKPYFVFSFLTRLFHGLMNEPQNADPFFHKFLLQATNEGLLNNTMVVVFGDHGLRETDFRPTTMGKYEERLPLFLLSFPQWFYEKYPKHYKNLQINQRRLTTLFDVHELFKDILNFNGLVPNTSLSSRGISLFSEISVNRTCANADISSQWCMCQKYTPVSVTREDVKMATEKLIGKINNITKEERNSCSILKLKTILSAEMYTADDEWSLFQITFEVKPSGGIFEGTAKYNLQNKQILANADFSRINKYGNQSDCIHNDFLRIFCYCVHR